METDESQPLPLLPRVLPFQLQFDKPVSSEVRLAEWNPEKDLLAMVTEDSKVLLHRFNWQRLWMISPGKCVKSLCWRPDGKAIAIGLEDGTISLHDVENGKLLRSMKSHRAAVLRLNWEEEDGELTRPTVEIIGFRMGELRGISRWHGRFGVVGLDEKLIDDATEKTGMLLVQVERFMIFLSSIVEQLATEVHQDTDV